MMKDTNFTQHNALEAVKARFEFCKEALETLESCRNAYLEGQRGFSPDIENKKLFMEKHVYYTGELEALRPAAEYYDLLILRSGRG